MRRGNKGIGSKGSEMEMEGGNGEVNMKYGKVYRVKNNK